MSRGVRLAVGAAQFGMPYGVSNRRGKPDLATVTGILACAAESGIDMIDTASAYGDSEAVIGESLRTLERRFLLITKTTSFSGRGIDGAAVTEIRSAFERSLRRLQTPSVSALLLHNVGDLLGPGAELLAELMLEFKACGKAQKIGVSVYEPWEIEAALARLAIDVVQVPLNVFDQRFARGNSLRRVAAAGIEIHCRSVFLQGALLMDPAELPAHLRSLGSRLSRFQSAIAAAGMAPLAAALAFARSAAPADRLIIGVNSIAELRQVAAAFGSSVPPGLDFAQFASEDLDMIDPRRWPIIH